MIRELINFTNDLVASMPEVLQWNNQPSKGLHIFIELDGNGNWKNSELQQGIDFEYYDGKTGETPLLVQAKQFAEFSRTVGASTDTNKILDMGAGGKKIHSCSPFVVSFKIKELINIDPRLNPYFEAAFSTCLGSDEKDSLLKQKSLSFKNACMDVLKLLPSLKIQINSKKSDEQSGIRLSDLKEDNYVYLYLKDVSLEEYKRAHDNYLKQKIFNDNSYNSEKELTDNTFGLSAFRFGLNSKKTFLAHKTASMYKGVAGRITPADARSLNTFDVLRARKVFPNPLPVFIDKEEFQSQKEIIKIFNDEGSPSYSQILKRIFENNPDRVLKNYYLLNYRGEEIKDFDFVSLFRYKTNNCSIQNLFKIKDRTDIHLHSIFGFESIVVRVIFNNILVRVDSKKETQSVKYFDEIDPQYVSGGETIYHLIMKYRQAIYDYIYKSKLNAITYRMFDDMMMNSIMADIKADEFDKFHTKDTSIREKLNIWFSLYNFFALNENQKRNIMAETLKEHRVMMQELIENKREVQTDEEFAFVAGQVIYYLLSKSETTDKSYARLEPFLQKSDCGEFKKAIVRIFDMYKHKNFSQKFSKGMAQVMAFNTNCNLKEHTPGILAGFFSDNLLFSDMNKQNDNE